MLFGRKKKSKLVSSTSEDETTSKPVEFYFDRKDVQKRLKRIRIPAKIFVRPDEINDADEVKIVALLQGVLKYIDRTFEEPGTFNVHKESIVRDLKEIDRKLFALAEEKPDKVLSLNAKYFVYPAIEAIKKYMERPWKY